VTRSRFAAVAASILLIGAAAARAAEAAPVLVLAADGHVHRVEDRYLPAVTPTPPPAELPARGPAAFATAVRHASRRPARHEITVVSRLAQLAARHQITAAQHRRYLTEFESALRTVKRLRGTRAAELEAVSRRSTG
jgi:hypothetical protein